MATNICFAMPRMSESHHAIPQKTNDMRPKFSFSMPWRIDLAKEVIQLPGGLPAKGSEALQVTLSHFNTSQVFQDADLLLLPVHDDPHPALSVTDLQIKVSLLVVCSHGKSSNNSR
jgi:hypothetical protein